MTFSSSVRGKRVPDSTSALLAEAKAILPEAVALRRRIHAEPELGLALPATQRAVLEFLAGLDLKIATGGATSAVVATLVGARPGPCVLLRADMDALPLQEETALPFASRARGRMHACGHDAHVAMLAAAARLLAAHREELAGSVKFLFQPGEEGYGGARILVEEGLLEAEPRPQAAFALHVNPVVPSGAIALRPGPILAAADVFRAELRGKGGHASMPHDAVDPIPVACEVVSALQAFVARRSYVFDPVVLSVTRIEAGTTFNVIPETVQLEGTLRSLSEVARSAARAGIERIIQHVAAAHDVTARVEIEAGYPVTVNDAACADFTQRVARELFGKEHVIAMAAPLMGAEDFSYVLQRIPGALAFLGVWPPGEQEPAPLHSNRMRLDEAALAHGIALHAAWALAYSERAPRSRPVAT